MSQSSGRDSIILTIIVLVLLTVGAWLFNKTTHELVIHPIERMLYTISQLQKKPLDKPVMKTEGGEEDSSETVSASLLFLPFFHLVVVSFSMPHAPSLCSVAGCSGAHSGPVDWPSAGGLRRGWLAHDCEVHGYRQW